VYGAATGNLGGWRGKWRSRGSLIFGQGLSRRISKDIRESRMADGIWHRITIVTILCPLSLNWQGVGESLTSPENWINSLAKEKRWSSIWIKSRRLEMDGFEDTKGLSLRCDRSSKEGCYDCWWLERPNFSLGELTISPSYQFQFPAFPHNFYFQVTNDLFKFLDSHPSEMEDPLAVPSLLSLPISSNIYTNMRNRTD
jgi:hypothetical protein